MLARAVDRDYRSELPGQVFFQCAPTTPVLHGGWPVGQMLLIGQLHWHYSELAAPEPSVALCLGSQAAPPWEDSLTTGGYE